MTSTCIARAAARKSRLVSSCSWLLVGLAALVSACGGGSSGGPADPPPVTPVEFRHEGLDGRVVTRINRHEDRLFAATDDGLFGKTIGQEQWESLGLADHKVQDIAILSGEHWLAAVFASSPTAFLEPQLLETVNGGANWLPVEHDFGGQPVSGEGIYALHYDAENGRLYATGIDALALSEDLGRSWDLLAGSWDVLAQPKKALNRNPARDQVWFGGQNAIEEMVLRRHDLGTGETEEFPLLLPTPATIKGITLDPSPGRRRSSLLFPDGAEPFASPDHLHCRLDQEFRRSAAIGRGSFP